MVLFLTTGNILRIPPRPPGLGFWDSPCYKSESPKLPHTIPNYSTTSYLTKNLPVAVSVFEWMDPTHRNPPHQGRAATCFSPSPFTTKLAIPPAPHRPHPGWANFLYLITWFWAGLTWRLDTVSPPALTLWPMRSRRIIIISMYIRYR